MNKKNDKPSVYTFIYWLIQDKKINPQDLFVFSELYWPEFIKKDKYVFIKEQFSEEEYNVLIKGNDNPEYWINLLTIDDFFSKLPDEEEKSLALVKTLVEIWGTKLKKNFPDMNFTIECLQNEEYGDCGLTFYQTDQNTIPQVVECFSEMPSPNIKENKIMQSSSGPRLGISKIRKPRFDELPKG